MFKGNLSLKAPFTVRASEEEIKFLNEIGSELNPNFDDSTTAREFVFWAVNKLTSQIKQPGQSSPADAEKIQLQENEIGRLKILLDQKDESIAEINEQFTRLTQTVHEPSELLKDNQGIISYPPIIARILQIEAEAAQKKTGKQFSREDLIIGLYWEAVKVGRAYPYKIWDRAELAAIANELKQQANGN